MHCTGDHVTLIYESVVNFDFQIRLDWIVDEEILPQMLKQFNAIQPQLLEDKTIANLQDSIARMFVNHGFKAL